MPAYPIRFTLTPAGAGSMQNPARCVAVTAPAPEQALSKLAGHYVGRNPRPYLIEIDGVWRKLKWRAFSEPLSVRGRGSLTGSAPEIGEPVREPPAPMPIETPAWASGGPAAPQPTRGDKFARIAAMAAQLAPTPSGAEAARILDGLRAALASDPEHRLEGRFKKMRALARAEGLWNDER